MDNDRRIAVVGGRAYGGVRMRGGALRQATGCPLVEPHAVATLDPVDTLVCIKCLPPLARGRCRRLIYDPLDVFYTGGHRNPETYWREHWDRVPFDVILGTSPACCDLMRRQLPAEVDVRLVPHQCDPRPEPAWRDSAGPVAYAGQGCFIDSRRPDIIRACGQAGREFRSGLSVETLRGASVCLALRESPYDTPINCWCKPQIKLENAAAAGLPIVASDHVSITSSRPDVITVPSEWHVDTLTDALIKALYSPTASDPYTTADYLADMARLTRQ